MTLEHHALVNDLPEYRERIHALKAEDAHFARLLADYTTLTEEIEKSEANVIAMSEEYEQALKTRRVRLKDDLLQMLRADEEECKSCGNACACGHAH